jgi:cation-dependent mannose-6-phosphate receptor
MLNDLLSVSIPSLSITTTMAEDKPCTLTLADGTHYDLTSLSSASADYVAEVGETSYKLNVCRSVVSEIWMKESPELVGGFVSRPSGDFSLG